MGAVWAIMASPELEKSTAEIAGYVQGRMDTIKDLAEVCDRLVNEDPAVRAAVVRIFDHFVKLAKADVDLVRKEYAKFNNRVAKAKAGK